MYRAIRPFCQEAGVVRSRVPDLFQAAPIGRLDLERAVVDVEEAGLAGREPIQMARRARPTPATFLGSAEQASDLAGDQGDDRHGQHRG